MLLSDGSRLELPPPALPPLALALTDTAAAAAAAAPRAMMAAIEKSVAPPEPVPVPVFPPAFEAAMAAAAAAAAAIAAGFCVPSSIAAVASRFRKSPICSPSILPRLALAPLVSSCLDIAAVARKPPLSRRGFEVSILRPF